MRTVACLALLAAVLMMMTACSALDLEALLTPVADESTPTDGLREALRVGTERAVRSLGSTDGYLGNVDVRLPLPSKLEKPAKALRVIGAGDLVDEFVTGINRAAEAAAPLAGDVFVDAIKKMTFSDAMTILRGDGREATDYLEKHSRSTLSDLFRPIVSEKLEAVGATRKFDNLMRKTEQVPFIEKPVFDLETYVTSTALDGLFITIGKEEERIRKDPVARTTALLKKYFGGND